jgi:hypothetical protein
MRSLQRRSIRSQSTSSIVPVKGFFVFHVTLFLVKPSVGMIGEFYDIIQEEGDNLRMKLVQNRQEVSNLTYKAGSQIPFRGLLQQARYRTQNHHS